MKGQERFKRWEEFFKKNVHVWEMFLHFSASARRVRDHFGARMIWERMRWYTMIETSDPDYKLNNDYTSYYARALVLRYPARYEGFFQIRDLRSDASDEDIMRVVEEAEKLWREGRDE